MHRKFLWIAFSFLYFISFLILFSYLVWIVFYDGVEEGVNGFKWMDAMGPGAAASFFFTTLAWKLLDYILFSNTQKRPVVIVLGLLSAVVSMAVYIVKDLDSFLILYMMLTLGFYCGVCIGYFAAGGCSDDKPGRPGDRRDPSPIDPK